MKSLSRALGRTLAALTVVTNCCTSGPDDPDTALDGRGASQGGRGASEGGDGASEEGGGGASEGGRGETTGGRRAQSNGGSRPAGDGGSSGADEAGGESGNVGGSPGDDPSAGASGDVDASGGDANGGTPSGGNANGGGTPSDGGTPSGGGTSSGGSSTGGGIPSGGFPSVDGCSTGRFWDPAGSDGLAAEGPWMNPGRMCQSCHREETGQDVVEIGGTVYSSLHEQDLCYGVDGTSINAEVVVTDNEGEVFRLPVGPTGNFSLLLEGAPRVQLPITGAKVVVGDREREMTYHPNVADCNYCHTREGRNGAPGRIFLP
jgi:hypothetical protein